MHASGASSGRCRFQATGGFDGFNPSAKAGQGP
jgi:hypothetical protein